MFAALAIVGRGWKERIGLTSIASGFLFVAVILAHVTRASSGSLFLGLLAYPFVWLLMIVLVVLLGLRKTSTVPDFIGDDNAIS